MSDLVDHGTVIVKSDDGEVVHVATHTGRITPKEIWETKDEWSAKVETSRKAWTEMSEDNREAMIRMATGALERMHDRVPEWIPEGLEVDGGNFVDIHIRFLFTDIDKEIDRNEQATSFQIKAAAEATQQALDELEALGD